MPDDDNECVYCAAEVPPLEAVPPAGDDAAWEALAAAHNPGCEWVATRAHRRPNPSAD